MALGMSEIASGEVYEPHAVVIVTPTILDGTVVRWYEDVEAVKYGGEVLSASRNGVMVFGYLTRIPAAWITDATGAWEKLAADRDADVSGLATHRTRFGRGEVEPIDRDRAEHVHGDGTGCFPGCPTYGESHPNYQPPASGR